jgi:predicted cation transporter
MLAVVGIVLPLLAFMPRLAEHGLDIEMFVRDLFATRVAAFFGWDVIVSAVTLLVALVLSPGTISNHQRMGIALGTLLVGVSLGLPLYLYFREQDRRTTAM